MRSKFNILDNNINGGKAEGITQNTIVNEQVSNNFEFSLGVYDTLFTLTRNYSLYKEGISNIISKIFIIKEAKTVNLEGLSLMLGAMDINNLRIYSIHSRITDTINTIHTDKGANIIYVEIYYEHFISFINGEPKFLEYNKNTLYILRDGNFMDMKNIFSHIEGYPVNLGRGGSQKSHLLSNLDFRLSTYIMAMFSNYNLIASLNAFDEVSKDRYLSYRNKYSKSYKVIRINQMPRYCENKSLGEYSLECSENNCF